MQSQKQFTDKVVVRFHISERVPRHTLYRRLDEVLALGILYKERQALYSHSGQPSLDPVILFKLLLVGRLENIAGDRRLLAHCAMRLGIRLFLSYELDEELPWHSTVSSTRHTGRTQPKGLEIIKAPIAKSIGALVAPLGFEPRTRTLKVYCSTS
jgi:transposase